MEDDLYEQRVLSRWAGRVDRHFYAKLVGVSFNNADGSSRQSAIRRLTVCEELVLYPDIRNEFDKDAILVCSRQSGVGVGHLERRQAGQVSRSLRKGFEWHCYVRRVLSGEGPRIGVVVCLVRLTKQTPADVTDMPSAPYTPAESNAQETDTPDVQPVRQGWWSRLFGKR